MALSKIQSESIDLADNFAGMRFGGTASDNALDDYEVGTWSITHDAGTSTHEASYIKVGDMVTVQVNVRDFTTRTGSTQVKFKGLPFTAVSGHYAAGGTMVRFINLGNSGVAWYINPGESDIRLYAISDNATWIAVEHGNLSSTSSQLILTATYRAA